MFLLILETEEEGERETLIWKRNIDQLPPHMHPNWGPSLQPRYVPRPGIRPTTLLLYKMMLQTTEPPGQGQMTTCF